MNPPVNPNVLFTYEDYLSLGYGDERRYELIEGELLLTPSPLVFHQVVAKRIEDALTRHVETHGLGIVLHAPLDVVLSDTNVVQPDVLFVRGIRREIIREACIMGPPDLVVEVVSPSTADRDLKLKRSVYSKYGVREYWIADPRGRTVEQLVYQGDGLKSVGVIPEGGTLGSHVVDGFTLEVTSVFRPLD